MALFFFDSLDCGVLLSIKGIGTVQNPDVFKSYLQRILKNCRVLNKLRGNELSERLTESVLFDR